MAHQYKIIIPKEYEFCLTKPSKKEIEDTLDQPITYKYISDAIARGDIKKKEQGSLDRWLGTTLRKALTDHESGI